MPELLSSLEMAEFVNTGLIRLDGIIPDEINRMAMQELTAEDSSVVQTSYGAPVARRLAPGQPLSACFGDHPAFRAVFDHPRVRGVIESLVGPDPIYDHHAVHVRQPGQGAQNLHADAIIDLRAAFDIQLMYYPSDVTLEAGGTLIVPGSHFRRVNEGSIARYQNHAGQVAVVCPAGTVIALHHGIWHCGRANRTSSVRYMFKIRLEPAVRQWRLWDTSDLDDPEVQRQVEKILSTRQPWFEGAGARLEQVQRAALWRHLTGDDDFQVEYWLGRLENQPVPQLTDLLPSNGHRPV